jgi:hypothetical protein
MVGSLVMFTFVELSSTPSTALVVVALTLVGIFTGPVQPISIEIGAECT